MKEIKLEVIKAELEQMKRSQDSTIKNYPEFKESIRITAEEIVFYEKLIIRLEKKAKQKSKPKQLELMV